MQQKQEHNYIIDIKGNNAVAEYARLRVQERHLHESMKLLPVGFVAKPKMRILDVASGAGGWCMNVAQAHPECEVIGCDINAKAVEYCTDEAETRGIENVEFHVADIMQPLEFDDESCDLVNARLLTGVLSRDYWTTFLAECVRILKPGGWIYITEPTTNVITNCPISHQFSSIILRALYAVGKTFSEYEYAVASTLNALFRQLPLCDVQVYPFLLDCSAWAPLHASIVDNMTTSARMMRPMVTTYGGVSVEEFDRLLEGSIEEMAADDYANLWHMASIQARKRER